MLDASGVLRALLDDRDDALEWIEAAARRELELCWPSLLYVEVANTLLVLERAAGLVSERGHQVLRAVYALPARSFRVERLAEAAWALGSERGLSAYDACYAVLAETLDAPLVTADEKLAAGTDNAVLIRSA